MSDTTTHDHRSFLRRLLTTPLGDLLRGQVTGTLDPAHLIEVAPLPVELKKAIRRAVGRAGWRLAPRADVARRLVIDFETQLDAGGDVDELRDALAAQLKRHPLWWRRLRADEVPVVTLPPELQRLVNKVVRKTRLSRRERRDVASELGEHFRDGLATGQSAEELARSFGDIGQAARLIRRAKLRNRSWQRQMIGYTIRAAQLSVGIAVLAWAYLAVRFFVSAPNITHNYLAEMDAEYVDIPADQSAWPLYREALMDLTPAPRELGERGRTSELAPEVREYVSKNKRAIALCRQAAVRPRMGFSFEDPSNGEWLAHSGCDGDVIEHFIAADGPMIQTLLPHIQEMRTLGRLLIADAWAAAEVGDGDTVVADVVAVLAMSRHVRDTHAFLISEFVSLALSNLMADDTGRILKAYPELLDEKQLATLADRFEASLDGGQFVVNFDGERALIADTLQRIYSDDGNGNGYVTNQGLQLFHGLQFGHGPMEWVAKPVVASRFASRREVRELVNGLFAEAAADAARPRWLRSSNDDAPDLDEILSDVRWFPLQMVTPSFVASVTAVDKAKQNREATLAVIALYRYHGRHGEWPETLEQLVPELLATLPVDEANGEPLRYRVKDGQPLLYSVGGNGIDDGGTCDRPSEAGLTASEGDWVLWPPAEPETP